MGGGGRFCQVCAAIWAAHPSSLPKDVGKMGFSRTLTPANVILRMVKKMMKKSVKQKREQEQIDLPRAESGPQGIGPTAASGPETPTGLSY